MQLNTKTVDLKPDLTVIVCEADASYDARLVMLSEQAEKAESEDKTFLFFQRVYYPTLAACTSGEAPTPDECWDLPYEKLDEWYLAVWELNPDLMGELREEKTEEVIFRDDSRITVHESRDLPSFLLRLVQLENEAQAYENAPAEQTSFRNYIYPKIAACSNGSKIPTADEAVNWPHTEIAKWSQSAMRLNSNWFQLIYDEAAKQAASKEKELVKKKSRRRSHRKETESAPQNG